MACNQCGKCCMENGLIPPLGYGEVTAPVWLWCLVRRLRENFADIAEEYPCVFLTDNMRCAIHKLDRPSVCVKFACKDTEVVAELGEEHGTEAKTHTAPEATDTPRRLTS